MYWDGSNWVDETPKPTPSLAPRKRRARDWAATGLMGLVLVGLIIPTVGVFAGSGSGGSVAAWSTNYKVTTYQENSTSVDWNGHWTRVSYRNYSGGRVRSTDQRGAGATVTFKGTGFAWIGPVGPTRGEAKVYVDGEYVKTVNMYASRYVASTVVFQQLFSGYGTHTFKMVSLATSGHPTVAVDKFIIRGNNKVPVEPVAAEAPAATPTRPGGCPTADPDRAPRRRHRRPVTATPTPTPVADGRPDPGPDPGRHPEADGRPRPRRVGKVVTVTSIAALKSALVDNSVDEIIVKNGTYHVSPSNRLAADSLWIGSSASGGPAFAERTRPIIVRAETRGGVTFDGGGGSGYGGLSLRGRSPRPDLGRLQLRQHDRQSSPGSSSSAATHRGDRRTTSRCATSRSRPRATGPSASQQPGAGHLLRARHGLGPARPAPRGHRHHRDGRPERSVRLPCLPRRRLGACRARRDGPASHRQGHARSDHPVVDRTDEELAVRGHHHHRRAGTTPSASKSAVRPGSSSGTSYRPDLPRVASTAPLERARPASHSSNSSLR